MTVVGRFSTQKSPVDATVDVILSGLFYGIEVNLAEYLEDATEQIVLKFAHAMAVSLDDVITNVRQVTLPHPVSVDINYYQKDFGEMMAATGMILLAPGVVVALDLLSFIFDPDFGVVPLSFSTSAVSFDLEKNEITALSTGTLSKDNVSPAAWACKPLCSGWWSFVCLGAEWPKVIEEDEHTVQVLTITEPGDTTRPSAVTDMEVTSVTSNSVTLEWTAPGDDGNLGTASQYDIRYSTSNITPFNWNSATPCGDEPTPKVAGSSESFVVTGLDPGTQYYFAMKTADEVSNWSGLSNVVDTMTSNEPPQASILSPNDGATFIGGETVCFSGEATDPEEGHLTGPFLIWTSDKDGLLGTGDTLCTNTLSENTHMITLSATDKQGAVGADTITLHIGSDSLFIDPRDGQSYPIVRIGGQWWMARNLNYATYDTRYYEYDTSFADPYGLLYGWSAACASCPPGWHLPTFAEWTELIDYLGGFAVAGGKMKTTGTLENGDGLWKAPNVGATNESGFSAVPSGFYFYFFNDFGLSHGTHAGFWSADTNAYGCVKIIELHNYTESVVVTADCGPDWERAVSIRCLRDR